MEFVEGEVKVSESYQCPELDERLLLFSIGVSRESSSILSRQVTKNNDVFLGRIKEIAYKAKDELEKRNYDAMGGLLDKSWGAKRKLAHGITNKKIDESYNMAIQAGALGGKIAGAGGGGFLLVYVPPERKNAVRMALRHLKELPFSFEPSGSRVIFNK
jgi:D-glycero-alpha-D-manno-heptose-7-phosphate kinase